MSRLFSAVAVISATLIGAATLAPVSAFAADGGWNAVSVDTREVDFNKRSDVAMLYNRIKAAARIVCESEGATDVLQKEAAKACEASQIDAAVAQVNRPQLTELSDRKSGRSPTRLAWNEASR
jgi:UrcA family protein